MDTFASFNEKINRFRAVSKTQQNSPVKRWDMFKKQCSINYVAES